MTDKVDRPTGDEASTHDARKSVAEAFFLRLVNDKRYDLVPEIFHEDIEIRPAGLAGHDGVLKWLHSFHDAFPDCHDTITGQWAEGDQVVTRIRFEETHTGPWMGFSPTGERVSWEGIAVHTVESGRVRRMETVIEQTHVFRQLGWLGTPDTPHRSEETSR